MLLSLPVALLSLAQATSAAPPPPSPTQPATQTPAKPPDDCRNQVSITNPNTIVVCAQRPQGYRIDPDVLEAKKEHREQNQHPRGRETFSGSDCAVVGPMGCRGGPTIDLVAAAAVLAQMAKTASEGGDVGKMFETTPEMSEYQLYVEAKKRREAKEAQKAAAAAKAKALAPKVAPAPPPPTTTPVPQPASPAPAPQAPGPATE